MLEIQAQQEDYDLHVWVSELLAEAVKNRQKELDAKRKVVEQLLLEALESGPPIYPDDEWWANFESETLALSDKQRQDEVSND